MGRGSGSGGQGVNFFIPLTVLDCCGGVLLSDASPLPVVDRAQ